MSRDRGSMRVESATSACFILCHLGIHVIRSELLIMLGLWQARPSHRLLWHVDSRAKWGTKRGQTSLMGSTREPNWRRPPEAGFKSDSELQSRAEQCSAVHRTGLIKQCNETQNDSVHMQINALSAAARSVSHQPTAINAVHQSSSISISQATAEKFNHLSASG